jgi:Zn-dependent oligopeptidase
MTSENLDRKKEFNKELKRLRKTFADLEGRKSEVANDLCEELASLKVEMKLLKTQYETKGSVDEMPQGNYSILRTSPYFTNYLNAAKTYSSLYKQILDLYPKEVAQVKEVEELDELQKFLKSNVK